jgi:hypothetical protein
MYLNSFTNVSMHFFDKRATVQSLVSCWRLGPYSVMLSCNFMSGNNECIHRHDAQHTLNTFTLYQVEIHGRREHLRLVSTNQAVQESVVNVKIHFLKVHPSHGQFIRERLRPDRRKTINLLVEFKIEIYLFHVGLVALFKVLVQDNISIFTHGMHSCFLANGCDISATELVRP